jgi:hypothetical protein
MQSEQSAQGGVAGAAQQAATEVQERAQELGGQAVEKTRAAGEQAAERVRETVDERVSQVAEQASSVAAVARRISGELRTQGNEGEARYAEQAAERIERIGGYLEQTDANALLAEIEDFGRRQPIAMAAGGLVLGVFAARFLKASSGQRAVTRGGNGGYGQGPSRELAAPPVPTAPPPVPTAGV